MQYLVYRHKTPSGGIYIGITHHTDPNKRWRNGHGYNDCVAFYNAILKYGWDNISHEIIAKNLSEFDAKFMEIQLIRGAKQNNLNCYNISSGGESAYGILHTNETKQKIRQSCKSNRWVNRDGVEKCIKVSELNQYLLNGWVSGHLHGSKIKSLITINKNGTIKRIHPDELDKYLSSGWIKGLGTVVSKNMSSSLMGYPWVNKNGTIKRIHPDELDKYLSSGWNRGRGKIGKYKKS